MRRQRGLAALIVVMVLFFVVSLVAAYTNRNLVFEQRTSANQYRSTQSFEVANAGLQWALSMLNGGRIDDSCQPSALATDLTFRQRYLAIDPATGVVTQTTLVPSGDILYAACVQNGTGWNCSCPSNASPSPSVPSSTEMHPAFQIRFVNAPAAALPPGVIRVESVSCPRWDTACLDSNNNASAEGRVVVTALAALQSGLKTRPAAALTVRQGIADTAAAIQAYNADVPSGGVSVQAGDALNATFRAAATVGGPPGMPPLQSIADSDASLSGITAAAPTLPSVEDRMFANFFGLRPAIYASQPGLVSLTCPCSAQNLRDAIAANPMRVVWAEGDVDFDTAGDIGSATDPLMLVATGSVTASTAGVNYYGVIYSRAASWATAGAATVHGAAIAESAISGTGTWTYVYDPAVLARIRWSHGSFVMVPGSWKDYSPLSP